MAARARITTAILALALLAACASPTAAPAPTDGDPKAKPRASTTITRPAASVAPTGLAFDKNGDLYIADLRHGQIKVVPKAQLAP